MTDKVLKDRYHISADELESRTQCQQKCHDEPIQKAVTILEMALDNVMIKLGVNIEIGNIPAQQEALGIIITEETRESMAGLNGFFVSVARKNDIIPYAWVGDAQLNSMGEVSCQIHWFQDNRLDEIGKVKIL